MSAVKELWTVYTFQRALRALLQLPAQTLQALEAESDLHEPLATDASRPTGEDWEAATAALRTLYRFARTDGVSEVVADVREVIARDLTLDDYDTGLQHLPRLLTEREAYDLQQHYRQLRAQAFPQIIDSQVALHFQAVDVAGKGPSPAELVPLILLRMTFDEPVLGSDSLTISIPIEELLSLSKEIDQLQVKYHFIARSLGTSLLPPEASLQWPGGGSRA